MPVQVITVENESWFKITDHDNLRPFFINLVSDSNHWMFISSNGGLTAGRKNPEFTLFPYYTDDKLTELAHTTGNTSIFQVKTDDGVRVWEPFTQELPERYNVSRNLYKNRFGNKIMFEEINHDLGLQFRYQWNSSNKYGFVKRSRLTNLSDSKRKITVLDGIQNVMPYGVSSDLQTRSSNLVDAYKRTELAGDSGLAIFALSAIIVDKAEPSEALKCNVAWSLGFDKPEYLLSSLQLDRFRTLEPVTQETDIKGEKGAYFVHSSMELNAGSEKNWSLIANVNQNHSQVVALDEALKSGSDLAEEIREDIELGSQRLKELVAGADGLQHTNDPFKDARHFSNTLFNIMRGGTFDHNYRIEKKDFVQYLGNANKVVLQRNSKFTEALPDELDKFTLDELLAETGDADLKRLAGEYLPLKFSRRHGDPSRPWNKFSINTRSEVDGSKILDYEGNWRDIFQNWEALAHSYPHFVEGMIFKFLNATTFDGYNPYRVTKGGFDWETIEPDDPWSYIGYWGDHQIIYLLKFLEFYREYIPEGFSSLIDKDLFVYANVPYRIKPYEDIAENPKDTIDFDNALDHKIRGKVEELGADGALLTNDSGELHRVHFMEKILATILAKVSNFIPEAGIWMNTQRPEWNDANNALVGNGVSMVTLYYLRRFLKFFEPVLAQVSGKEIEVSKELRQFFETIAEVLNEHNDILQGPISDAARKKITDGLGKAASAYRTHIYNNGFTGDKTTLKVTELETFVALTLNYLEHSIEANRREDDLYHAYNLMQMEKDGISVSYLDEMLEGQVAVLSSKYLKTDEALKVLNALRNSSLYREDQQSYILYPNKSLPGFLEKNSIMESQVQRSELLTRMVDDNDQRIISKDVRGEYHFNGNFKNARDLREALNALEDGEYGPLVEKDRDVILAIFEEVFNHKAFTGRSGTFYGYEGLGSIYWHMVSKLYLAAFEVCKSAHEESADRETVVKLAQHFDEIETGIGVHKSPELYGAFPTDAYSHTPYHKGAQQPGMTGQVKEDMLVRFGELGIGVTDGKLSFKPFLLRDDEFKTSAGTVHLSGADQQELPLSVPENSLCFTCCQVPVIYTAGDYDRIIVHMHSGDENTFDGLKTDEPVTEQVFRRTGEIRSITVKLKKEHLM